MGLERWVFSGWFRAVGLESGGFGAVGLERWV